MQKLELSGPRMFGPPMSDEYVAQFGSVDAELSGPRMFGPLMSDEYVAPDILALWTIRNLFFGPPLSDEHVAPLGPFKRGPGY